MAKTLKIGIMGGIRGQGMAGTLNMLPDVEFSALLETNPASVEAMRPFLGPNTVIYSDWDAFIHSGLDGVVLANYFDEHAKFAIPALKEGIAVLSDTTAAPSLGECVDLVETCEKYNGKYMLGVNCLYYWAVHAMREKIRSGETGKVLYAEAEYLHGEYYDEQKLITETDLPKMRYKFDPDNLHWRQCLPPNFYNMHTLGPLMWATESMPKRVTCHMIRDEEQARRHNKYTDCVGSAVITEMDNGAVFNTTGCSNYPPTSKWYRVACEKETLETERYPSDTEKLFAVKNGKSFTSYDVRVTTETAESCGALRNCGISAEQIAATTHGGKDFYNVWNFIRYVRGEQEAMFDVYQATALSAVGILGWMSALMDSKPLEIPDFRDPAERDKVRGDYRKPFARRASELTMPCRLADKARFTGYPLKK